MSLPDPNDWTRLDEDTCRNDVTLEEVSISATKVLADGMFWDNFPDQDIDWAYTDLLWDMLRTLPIEGP